MPFTFKAEELTGPDAIRSIIQLIREAGDDWRAVLDGIRPHVPAIWKSLSWEQRARFLTHIQPYWNSVRHRMAAPIHDRLEKMSRFGRLNLLKRSISSITKKGEAHQIYFEGGHESIDVDWIINCTGPQISWRAEKFH